MRHILRRGGIDVIGVLVKEVRRINHSVANTSIKLSKKLLPGAVLLCRGTTLTNTLIQSILDIVQILLRLFGPLGSVVVIVDGYFFLFQKIIALRCQIRGLLVYLTADFRIIDVLIYQSIGICILNIGGYLSGADIAASGSKVTLINGSAELCAVLLTLCQIVLLLPVRDLLFQSLSLLFVGLTGKGRCEVEIPILMGIQFCFQSVNLALLSVQIQSTPVSLLLFLLLIQKIRILSCIDLGCILLGLIGVIHLHLAQTVPLFRRPVITDTSVALCMHSSLSHEVTPRITGIKRISCHTLKPVQLGIAIHSSTQFIFISTHASLGIKAGLIAAHDIVHIRIEGGQNVHHSLIRVIAEGIPVVIHVQSHCCSTLLQLLCLLLSFLKVVSSIELILSGGVFIHSTGKLIDIDDEPVCCFDMVRRIGSGHDFSTRKISATVTFNSGKYFSTRYILLFWCFAAVSFST